MLNFSGLNLQNVELFSRFDVREYRTHVATEAKK